MTLKDKKQCHRQQQKTFFLNLNLTITSYYYCEKHSRLTIVN